MKKLNKLIKNIAILVVSALAMSCNGIMDTPDTDLPEAYLKIKSSPARSVTPDFEMNDFDTLVLSGIYPYDATQTLEEQADKLIVLGTWNSTAGQTAYQQISSTYIAVPGLGNWYLSIDAGKHSSSESETKYSGNLVKTITSGPNSISFVLDPVAFDTNGAGDILVPFVFTGITNPDDYKVVAVLSDSDSYSSSYNLQLDQIYDADGIPVSGAFTATLDVKNISSGDYILKFYVSKEDATYGTLSNIITKTQTVKVTNGVVSVLKEAQVSVTETLVSEVINATTFTISYDLAGGTWEDEYSAPASYVAYEKDGLVLPSAANVKRTGYIFDGWYSSSDYSKQLFTSLPYQTRGNQELVAKWHWDSDQTVNVNKNGEDGTAASLSFSWDAVPGATGYKVFEYYGIDSDYEFDSEATTPFDITGTSFKGKVGVNRNVFYAVRAYNSNYDEGGITDFSDVIKYEKITTLPAPSVNYEAGVISWEPVYGADFYYIYTYSTTDDAFDVTNFSSYASNDGFILGCSYSCTSSFSQDYYYGVKAYNALDYVYSNMSDVTKTDKAAAPVLTYGAGTISWSTVSEATKYEIYTYSSTDYYAVSDEEAGDQFDVSNLSMLCSVTYSGYMTSNSTWTEYKYYAVKASDGTNSTGFSNVLRLDPISATAPVVTVGTADSDGKAQVSWTTVDGATSYLLYTMLSSNDEVEASDVLASGPGITYYSNSTEIINDSTTYNKFFVIRAVNSSDTATFDSIVYKVPKYDFSVAPVLTLSGTTLSWTTDSTGSYETCIYKYTSTEDLDLDSFDMTLFGGDINYQSSTTSSSMSVSYNTSTENNLYYVVKFYHSIFGYSTEYSNVVKQPKLESTMTSTLNVTGLSDDFVLYDGSNFKITYNLSWDSLGDGITYSLYKSETTDFTGVSPFTTVTTNSYSTTSLFSSSEKYYYIVVKASYGIYESASLSDPVCVRNARKGDFSLTYTNTNSGIIDWIAMDGAATYDVYYSQRTGSSTTTQKSGFTLCGADITGTTYTKTSYNTSDYWTFYVVAKDSDGNQIGISNFVGY